jgi:hypothetical protein
MKLDFVGEEEARSLPKVMRSERTHPHNMDCVVLQTTDPKQKAASYLRMLLQDTGCFA